MQPALPSPGSPPPTDPSTDPDADAARFAAERRRQKDASRRRYWSTVASFVAFLVSVYVRGVPRATRVQSRAFSVFIAEWFFGPSDAVMP